jgi:hypothetical protein
MDPFFAERMALAYPRPSSGPFKYVYNRHDGSIEVDGIERCDGDRLMYLLTYITPPPLLTKAGKPRVHQPPPHKDETGKFYSAQCVHYGLSRKSQKTTAKNALLAFAKANGGKFIVPPAIAEVEAKLAQQFQAEKADYDAKVAAINDREQNAKKEARKKRAREEDELQSIIAKKSKKTDRVVSSY